MQQNLQKELCIFFTSCIIKRHNTKVGLFTSVSKNGLRTVKMEIQYQENLIQGGRIRQLEISLGDQD
jgi:hypothetical protein